MTIKFEKVRKLFFNWFVIKNIQNKLITTHPNNNNLFYLPIINQFMDYLCGNLNLSGLIFSKLMNIMKTYCTNVK